MAKFIKLTKRESGRSVLVNVDLLVLVEETASGYVRLRTMEPAQAVTVEVKESVRDIQMLLPSGIGI